MTYWEAVGLMMFALLTGVIVTGSLFVAEWLFGPEGIIIWIVLWTLVFVFGFPFLFMVN